MVSEATVPHDRESMLLGLAQSVSVGSFSHLEAEKGNRAGLGCVPTVPSAGTKRFQIQIITGVVGKCQSDSCPFCWGCF